LEEGVLTYSTQPTSDGYAADQTMLAPAFTTTEEDFVEMVSRLRRAVETVASDITHAKPFRKVIG
jgi:hypothetical protein